VTEADSSLARRVRELEDREAIRDLAKDYCNAVDDRDAERYGSLMAKDVVLVQFGGTNLRVGRDVAQSWMAWRFTQWGVTRHYPLNHLVTLTGPNQAVGVVNGWAEMAMDAKMYVTSVRYDDTYVREEGSWRFAKRDMAYYYYAALTDLPAIYDSPFRKMFRDADDRAVLRRGDLPEGLATYAETTTRPVPEVNATAAD
jgi:uncharacterized protein (TIGR02246 family)